MKTRRPDTPRSRAPRAPQQTERAGMPRPGEELRLEIAKLVGGGKGLARHEGLAVFVDRGLPGQTVLARVTAVRKRLAEAVVSQVITAAPHEVKPLCRHFHHCGGCDWQHLDYPAQLEWKRTIVSEALRGLGRVDLEGLGIEVEPVRPSPQVWGFRNKMEFAFGPPATNPHAAPDQARAGQDAASPESPGPALGLRRRSRPELVFEARSCMLMAAPAMDVLEAVRQACAASGLMAHDPDSAMGTWRFCVLRRTVAGQMQVLVLSTPDPRARPVVERLAKDLLERFPAVRSVVHGIRTDRLRLAAPQSIQAFWGQPRLEETLAGHVFQLSPGAFFQTNTQAAEELVKIVVELAGLTGREEVFDCYAGVGAMSLALARRAGRVTAFEAYAHAVDDAVDNATANGVVNVAFMAGDLAQTLRDTSLPRPDVVVLDPPRAGMDPAVVEGLLALAPRRIVAVSCDPATLARDLRGLAGAYAPARVCPVDLFPHSSHVETMVRLDRVSDT